MELTIIQTSRGGRKAYQDVNGDIYVDCKGCPEVKPLNQFYKDKQATLYQTSTYCKECTKARTRQRRKENPEKKRESDRKYLEKNKERKKELDRIYREANKERLSEWKKEWYKENRERMCCRMQDWRKNNRKRAAEMEKRWQRANTDKLALRRQKRRALIKGLPSTLDAAMLKTILKGQDGRCYISGETSRLELEHFVPLSWNAGGTTFENCYYMSQALNRSKKDKNPFEWIKRQPQEYQDNFHNILVPELAARNDMSIEEFTEYVYQCEKNAKNAKELVL